jgi:hypothetical protein
MTPAVNSRSAADAPPPKMPALSQDAAFPHEALLRLPQLHREVSRNFSEARLLARAPAAALLLMLAGAATLLCAARDESLTIQAGFAWSVLVWAGIALMTRTYIRGFARAADPVPLSVAAADLRAILLYTGLAWGAGAYLVLPAAVPALAALAFALLPPLGLTLLLRDERAATAFALPVALLAGAALTEAGRAGLAAAIGPAVLIAGFLPCLLRRSPALPQLR